MELANLEIGIGDDATTNDMVHELGGYAGFAVGDKVIRARSRFLARMGREVPMGTVVAIFPHKDRAVRAKFNDRTKARDYIPKNLRKAKAYKHSNK